MDYRRNFTLLFLCLFAVLQVVIAQNSFSVKGIVADSVSGEKLFYANIVVMTNDTLQETVAHTTSDVNGAFLLKDIPQGAFLLKASYVGYEIYSQTLTLNATSSKIIDLGTVFLAPGAMMLNTVEIKPKNPFLHRRARKCFITLRKILPFKVAPLPTHFKTHRVLM